MAKTSPKFLVVLKNKSGGFLRLLFGEGQTKAGLSSEPLCVQEHHLSRNGTALQVLSAKRSGLHRGALKSRPDLHQLPEAMVGRFRQSWYARIKLALDFGMALTILVVTWPVVLLAMLLVKLTSRGPALYTQTRVGLDGKPFTLYKIRSMVYQCESLTGARWATPGDSRVTPVGRFLRQSHLDELPQLWNVLRGEMSLIGPRPERPEFVPQLENAVPLYRTRLLVRPGLTGLAQVQLPPDTNLDSVRIKLAYDIWYVRHVSFFMDLRILFGTACKLAGFSFGLIRRTFGFAPKEKIQQSYHELTSQAAQSIQPCA